MRIRQTEGSQDRPVDAEAELCHASPDVSNKQSS